MLTKNRGNTAGTRMETGKVLRVSKGKMVDGDDRGYG